MDIFFFLSLSLTLVVLAISLIYAIFSSSFKQKKITLPPGNFGWPIFGETLDFVRSAQRGNQKKFITDRMNKYSPTIIFKTSLFGQKMAVFCGVSGNKCLFSSDKFLTTWFLPSMKRVFFSPENIDRDISQYTTEGRKMTNLFLKPEVLQKKFVGIMDYMSKQHIEKKWAPHKQVLAYELAKDYTFELACRLFMSIEDPKEVARLADLFKNVTNGMISIPISFPGTPLYRAVKSATVIRNDFLAIVEQRKIDLLDKRSDLTSSQQDMLSLMLLSAYDQDGEFPNDMIVCEMFLFLLVGGHDTATTTITFIVKYLAEFPHVYAEVLKEQLEIAKNKKTGDMLNWEDIQKMKYSWSVACEAMRLAPPGQGSLREVTTDFTCAGFTIPKGWKAYWTVHSTNTNPEYFKDPEKFDPTRFQGNGPTPYSFAPFGGGIHICPGREFARVEILAFMHNLVQRFELEKVLPDEKTIYILGATPANGLPIRIHPRNGQTN